MEKQYFRITFGKSYSNNYDSISYDSISLMNDKYELGPSVSLYARYVDGVLKEVVSGMEIPEVIFKMVPGFGAYEKTLLSSLSDFLRMHDDVVRCKNNMESFMRGLLIEKAGLDKIHKKYISTNKYTYEGGEASFNDESFIEFQNGKLRKLIADISLLIGDE